MLRLQVPEDSNIWFGTLSIFKFKSQKKPFSHAPIFPGVILPQISNSFAEQVKLRLQRPAAR